MKAHRALVWSVCIGACGSPAVAGPVEQGNEAVPEPKVPSDESAEHDLRKRIERVEQSGHVELDNWTTAASTLLEQQLASVSQEQRHQIRLDPANCYARGCIQRMYASAAAELDTFTLQVFQTGRAFEATVFRSELLVSNDGTVSALWTIEPASVD